ncbi:glycoside hydrolase family 127 protein, partial [Candidatus Pacearchaeota archaeon]|nr:glycoside hydrolase family 127 protein [Candidatus Pacearchaeota archaeon]
MKKLTVILCSIFMIHISYAQQQGIINNAESPHVKLKSINIGDCQWTSGFWADKFKVCQEVMVPHMGNLLKGDIGHAYNNFKIVAGLKEGQHQGTHWHDGDFYKWMESAMYVYGVNKDEQIIRELGEIIEVIGKAQAEDGYLHTSVMIKDLGRYSKRGHHELYCSGHLLTSACIHHRVTEKTNFLDIAVKHADYLYKVFKARPKHLARFGFNPTQITGLVELYRTTRDRRYLELAKTFINMRGQGSEKNVLDPAVRLNMRGDMAQDRTPIRKETEAVGHAVLALYLYAGVADIYAETGERALIDTLDRLWENIVNKKMYLTGAVGQIHHGVSTKGDMVHEAFIDAYMMPNATAYNETCANICNAMFNWRMLGVKGESKYADIMELVLYNSALSGISIDGTHYFYTNPLRRTGDHEMDTTDHATRVPYIPCFCCPPNMVRTIAKSPGWAYSLSENGIAVNLYGGNKLDTQLVDGSRIQLMQDTQYPWDGEVKITMKSCKKAPFEMLLRIPEWAEGSKIMVNGKEARIETKPGTYAKVKRKWKTGDVVALDMPMDIKLIEGHRRIEEVRNQAAIKRGPVVYCVETPDLPGNT